MDCGFEHYKKTIMALHLKDGNAVSALYFSGVSFTCGIVTGDQVLIPASITVETSSMCRPAGIVVRAN